MEEKFVYVVTSVDSDGNEKFEVEARPERIEEAEMKKPAAMLFAFLFHARSLINF